MEGGFATTIETSTELDLRNAARSKVTNVSAVSAVVAGGVVTVVTGGSVAVATGVVTAVHWSVSAVIACVSTIVARIGAVSGDKMARVIENGSIGKLGDNAKDGVESISLNTSLDRGSSRSSGLGIGASMEGGTVSLTSVHELIAHGLGDNIDVLGRSVGVGF